MWTFYDFKVKLNRLSALVNVTWFNTLWLCAHLQEKDTACGHSIVVSFLNMR